MISNKKNMSKGNKMEILNINYLILNELAVCGLLRRRLIFRCNCQIEKLFKMTLKSQNDLLGSFSVKVEKFRRVMKVYLRQSLGLLCSPLESCLPRNS